MEGTTIQEYKSTMFPFTLKCHTWIHRSLIFRPKDYVNQDEQNKELRELCLAWIELSRNHKNYKMVLEIRD